MNSYKQITPRDLVEYKNGQQAICLFSFVGDLTLWDTKNKVVHRVHESHVKYVSTVGPWVYTDVVTEYRKLKKKRR